MKNFLCGFVFFLIAIQLKAQPVSTDIQFVNTGAMNVAGTMYVNGSMQMKDRRSKVEVVHNGTTILTGSFFQDASGNVFQTENDDFSVKTKPRGVGTSTGTFRFYENNRSKRRYITSSDTLSFDRTINYIAFPNIDIQTNDIIYVPCTMGLDVRTITRRAANTGVLYLASNRLPAAIYDASLRVTGHNGTYTVAPDAVVVEKRVKEFRETSSGGESTMLMPFASPFENLRSGYFAGNWIRRPLLETDKNSFYYPYGNRDKDKNGIIDRDQYIIDPFTNFTPTEAYLLRLQKAGGTIDDLYSGLNHTSGEAINAHDKDKFMFNGTPYLSLGTRTGKKLFAGYAILERTVLPNKQQTQNWLVGNSYTSALNTKAIADYLMNEVNSYFVGNIYIYHHGAAGYETYAIWENNRVPDNLPDILPMSIFMIAATAGNSYRENITIGPEYQIHAGGISPAWPNLSNPLKKAKKTAAPDKLDLILTPADNPFVYDRTSIKLTAAAAAGKDDEDLGKLRHGSSRLFQLYGTNTAGAVLQQNALPLDADKAMLSVSPGAEEMECELKALNPAEFISQELLLYDSKLNTWSDLRYEPSYTFTVSPGDNPDRFELHFASRNTTGTNTPDAGSWKVYIHNDKLIINGLEENNLENSVQIFSASGELFIQETIQTIPEHSILTRNLPKGVYILSLAGRSIKFVK